MKKTFSYNSRCLELDGKPWFPVMGEMHYSRYRETFWEESLRKIKAGGVTIVSSYVIWIHHEEEEGVFDFSGCRDLRKFLTLCQKVGLYVFLRLGPWVHGEVRNGGFPDWLMAKEGICLRSDDETYLGHVRHFWEKVYAQTEGFLYDDNGPVIGIQIENEYGHVGGLNGKNAGDGHIRTLTALAKEIGFQVPLYTATGWGGACIGDLLPVMGGYCEAPWDPRTTEIEANANFVFSHIRNDALIACDHHTGDTVTFDESKFPYLTAELGGGLQVTAHRRPVAEGRDIGAMSLAKLGSGVALLGYYMYHGGSNPEGKLSTLQESKAAEDLNDLPEINYDFNAPIRQYGGISDSYREIKLLAYFLQDFGEDLAPLAAEIQDENVRPDDVHTLRVSCRHDEQHGYVFYNNYQRRRKMDAHHNVMLAGRCGSEMVTFPSIDIADGEYGFFPYRMKMGEAVLKTALATPLCRLHTAQGDTYVFYGDHDPMFDWEGEKRADVLHLSRADGLRAFRVKTDQEYLILSDGYVWEEDQTIRVTGPNNTVIKCFPKPAQGIEGFAEAGQDGRFWIYERKTDEKTTVVTVRKLSEDAQKAEYELIISYSCETSGKKRAPMHEKNRTEGYDTILEIDFAGERMEIFDGERKINDYFYTGQKAVLSLGYFDFPRRLRAVVQRLHRTDRIFLETWPVMDGESICCLRETTVQEEYR